MWNAFFNALSVSSCILSIAAIFYGARTATRLRELQAALRPLPLSRLQSIETSIEGITEELLRQANSLKMQRVRSAATHATKQETAPDPYRDPDGWRKMMNAKLAAQKIGGAQ